MSKRTAAVLVVMVLVLGGGLVGLQLAEQRRAASRTPAAAKQSPAPSSPATPAVPSRPLAPASDAYNGTIDGRVLDGVTHEGIANAELTFLGDDGASTFRTRNDGGFALAAPATGSFVLASISAPGFLPYSPPVGFSGSRLTLTRGQAVHDITLLLYPAVDYEGIVVDARGAPVPGVRVRLLAPAGEQLESPQDWTSGADGRFTFQAADAAVLEASRGALRGWAHVDRSVVIMKKLTIRLGYPPPHDATISGWVRDAGGTPLADVVVRAAPAAYYGGAPTVVATTGADGKFTISGVARTASYDLSAEAEDHLKEVRTSVPGGSRNVVLTLDAGLPIDGQVVDAHGAPVPSFTLIVQRQVGLARERVATLSLIDPQGRFSVRVAKGDYDLIASAPEQPRGTAQAAAGASGVRIVIGSGGILRGRVVSSEDGAPIADAFVAVETAQTGVRMQSVVPVTATLGDGTFELAGLSSGAVALAVAARGYARKIEELPASDDGVRGPITIRLARGSDLPRSRDVIGIGVQLVPEGDALRVVAVFPSSGAHDAGVTEGDLIVAIDGVPVATLDLDGAIGRIRGPVGTSVTLTVRRDGHDGRVAVERRQLRS